MVRTLEPRLPPPCESIPVVPPRVPVVPLLSDSPVLLAHTVISFRIFLPTCWRSLRSLMTPCRRTRTGCAPAGTSPRAAWWAFWSRRPSSSARSVHTAVRASTVSLNSGVGALSAGLNVQPVPLHDDTTCRSVQGRGGAGGL